MPSIFILQAQKEAAISAAKDDIIALALGILVTHQNANLSLNVKRKLTWNNSFGTQSLAPTASQRNAFTKHADTQIVSIGIEAGLWNDSEEAGRIGLKAFEEYALREEKKLVQERLRTASNVLNDIMERLGIGAINHFDQGFGSAGPGEPWITAEEELRNALRAFQSYRKVDKSIRPAQDTGFLDTSKAETAQSEGDRNTQNDNGWGTANEFHRNKQYEKSWATQQDRSWSNEDQDDGADAYKDDQGWGQYDQEESTHVNDADQYWGQYNQEHTHVSEPDQGWGQYDLEDTIQVNKADQGWGDVAQDNDGDVYQGNDEWGDVVQDSTADVNHVSFEKEELEDVEDGGQDNCGVQTYQDVNNSNANANADPQAAFNLKINQMQQMLNLYDRLVGEIDSFRGSNWQYDELVAQRIRLLSKRAIAREELRQLNLQDEEAHASESQQDNHCGPSSACGGW